MTGTFATICVLHKECWPKDFHICKDCRFDHEERIIEAAGKKPVKIIRPEDITELGRRAHRILTGQEKLPPRPRSKSQNAYTEDSNKDD